MNRQGIIERVKIVLDEFTPVNEGVIHPIDAYIDPVLDDSVRELFKEFPIDKLWQTSIGPGDLTGPSRIIAEGNRITVVLDESMVRVASVKLSDWTRMVHEREFKTTDAPEVAWQGSPWTQATPWRPLVVKHQQKIANGAAPTIDCYGTIAGTIVEQLNVVQLCEPEDVKDDLLTPLVYLTASMVALHLERQDIYKAIYEQYQKHLQ